jgi:hypothetical protein
MAIPSLYQRATCAGANSRWLNPENQGQGRISTYLGKPIRAVARMVYGFACTTIFPLMGVFYHTGQAIKNTVQSKEQERAWSHLKAAAIDAGAVAATSFFILGASLQFVIARRLPATQRVRAIFLFSILLLTFAFGSLFPLMFSIQPHAFRR